MYEIIDFSPYYRLKCAILRAQTDRKHGGNNTKQGENVLKQVTKVFFYQIFKTKFQDSQFNSAINYQFTPQHENLIGKIEKGTWLHFQTFDKDKTIAQCVSS